MKDSRQPDVFPDISLCTGQRWKATHPEHTPNIPYGEFKADNKALYHTYCDE